MYLLWGVIGTLECLHCMSFVTGQSDYFSFGFTALAWKDLPVKGIVLSIEIIETLFYNIRIAAKLVMAW